MTARADSAGSQQEIRPGTATDIKQGFAARFQQALGDPGDPRRAHPMQRAHWTLGVPPARSKGIEPRNFSV